MDSDVQKIKDKLAITEVVGQYVQLRRAGRSHVGRCPFHKERTPSFHVSAERGTYKCFGCGEGGDIFTFVQKIDNIDFSAALKMLAERAGVELKGGFTRSPEAKEKDARLRDICEAAAQYYVAARKGKKEIQDYLHTRGLTNETIEEWRVGYAPAEWDALSKHLTALKFSHDDIVEAGFGVRSEKRQGELFDRFRGRIMFPIFDVAGQPIAFSGRFYEKVPGQRDDIEPAKYINSPETPIFKKSRTLYGFDRAKAAIRKADCILLVEGQFDLLMSHQSGLPFAVALSGTALTEEHLSLLSRVSKRLVLALDADAAGVRSGLKSAQMALRAGFDVKIPTFPAGKDPADVAKESPERLKAAVRTSQTAVEFFLDALRPGAKDERAYKKLVEQQVVPLLGAIGSSIDREHFVSVVAQRLQVPDTAVREAVTAHPVAEEHATSPDVHAEPGALTLTPLERVVGMLLCSAPDVAEAKLKEFLGEERLAQVRAASEPHAERLQFEFDEQGEQPELVATELLRRVEQTVLSEKIAELQKAIATARGQEGSTLELTKKLQTLKRQEEALRI